MVILTRGILFLLVVDILVNEVFFYFYTKFSINKDFYLLSPHICLVTEIILLEK